MLTIDGTLTFAGKQIAEARGHSKVEAKRQVRYSRKCCKYAFMAFSALGGNQDLSICLRSSRHSNALPYTTRHDAPLTRSFILPTLSDPLHPHTNTFCLLRHSGSYFVCSITTHPLCHLLSICVTVFVITSTLIPPTLHAAFPHRTHFYSPSGYFIFCNTDDLRFHITLFLLRLLHWLSHTHLLRLSKPRERHDAMQAAWSAGQIFSMARMETLMIQPTAWGQAVLAAVC